MVKKYYGEEDANTLVDSGRLAVCLDQQGRYTEAIKLYKEVLKIDRKVHGLGNRETLGTKCNLANALSSDGQHEAAEKMLRVTLKTMKRVLGDDDVYTMTAAESLAKSCLIKRSMWIPSCSTKRRLRGGGVCLDRNTQTRYKP